MAAGLSSTTNHFSVQEALVGRCNEWLYSARSAKLKRCALSARIWRCPASRASGQTNHAAFLKLTAVTERSLWGCGPKDRISLRVGDLRATPGGAIQFQLRRLETEAGKAAGERPFHGYPPSKSAAPDFFVLRRPRLLQ